MAQRESTKFGQICEEVNGRSVYSIPGSSTGFEWKLTPGSSALLWTDSDYDVLDHCQEIRFDDITVSIDDAGQITTSANETFSPEIEQLVATPAHLPESQSEPNFEPTSGPTSGHGENQPAAAITAALEGATIIDLSDYVQASGDEKPVVTKAWAGAGEIKILGDGNLAYMPNDGQVGRDDITIIVHDGHWSTQVMKIRIENQIPLPELGSQLIPNQFDGMDTHVSLDIGGYLSDLLIDENVTISVTGLPPGLNYIDSRMHIEGVLNSGDGSGDAGQTHIVYISITTAAGQVLTTQFKWIIQEEKALDAREALTRAVPPIASQSDAAAAAVLYSVASQAALAARGFSLSSSTANTTTKSNQSANQFEIAKPDVLAGESGKNSATGKEGDNLFDLRVATPSALVEESVENFSQLQGAFASVNLSKNASNGQNKAPAKANLDLNPDGPTDTDGPGPGAANEAPFAGTPSPVGTAEDSSLFSIDVLSAAYDPEGDPLGVSSASASFGTVTINADNTLDYLPDPDYNGNDTITYTVSDSNGNSVSGSVAVTVLPVNDAPVAGPVPSQNTSEDASISNIDVLTTASDIDGDSLSVISATASNGTVTINPDSSLNYSPNTDYFGSDTIVFTISDGNGGTDSSSVIVAVSPVNDAPRLSADSATVLEDSAVIVDVLANDADIDGTIDSTTVQIGSTASPGDPLVVAGQGTWTVDGTTGAITFTPLADYAGPVSDITYTVADNLGARSNPATVSVNITPVNDAPVAVTETGIVLEDGTIVFDALANDFDIDGTLDPASVQIVGTSNPGDALIVPGEGIWTINTTNGEITFNPVADYDGAVTDINYTVRDDQGGLSNAATISVAITPVNDAPVTSADSGTVLEDGVIAINVLANDTDIDGTLDPATVQIGSTANPGDSLIVAGEGTWSVNTTTGEILFTPEADYNGSVTDITYTVSDNSGAVSNAAPVSVTITDVNDAPTANADSDVVAEDGSVAIDVLANDTDLDGTLDPSTVQIAGTPGPGTSLTVAGEGIWSVNTTSGHITFTPETDFDGLVSDISYTVRDDDGALSNSVTVSVTITSSNDAPVAGAVPDSNTNEDAGISNIDVLSYVTDVDGDTVSVVGASAANGSATVNPDGSINYTPNGDYNGTDTISFDLDDGNGGTSSGTFDIIVAPVNDDPNAGSPPLSNSNEDTSLNNIDVLSYASDIDGDILSVTGPTAANGTVTINPDGSLNYTPNTNFNGLDTISYTIDDGNGGTAAGSKFVFVNSVNDAPTAGNDSAIVAEDGSVTVNVLGNDNDIDGSLVPATVQIVGTTNPGDPLTVPGEGTWSVNSISGEVTFIPEADYNGSVTPISYTVEDNSGAVSNPATISVTITPVNDAPVVDLSDISNIIINGNFTDGVSPDWSGWLESGSFDNAGNGANAPAVTNHNTNGLATITQTGLSGLSTGPGSNGAAVVNFDFGWSDHGHDSESIQLTLSVAGVDYAQITTTSGPGTTASVVYFNGATGPAALISSSPEHNWVHYPVEVNLPASVADTGDITFSWLNLNPIGEHTDEASIDNVQVFVANADPSNIDTQVQYSAGEPPVQLLDASSSISDLDGTTLQSAQIALANAESGDQLLVNGAVAVNGSSGTVNGLAWSSTIAGVTVQINISGAATHADYLTALSLIEFENTLSNPAATARSIDITVNDGIDNSTIATAQVLLGVDVNPPMVTGDAPAGFEDTPLVINVLANDSAGDAAIDPTTVQLQDTASAGDPLTVVGEGTWTVNSTTGEITFTGEPEFSGTPTPINYSVEDINGLRSAPAEINATIAAVNDAPVAILDSDAVIEDGSVVIDVLSNDSDIDGTLDPATVQITGTVSAGDPLVVSGEGTWSVNTSTGEISFAPEANYTGSVTAISYTVRDNGGTQSTPATVAVSITAVNDAPTLDLNLGSGGNNSATAYSEGSPSVAITSPNTAPFDVEDSLYSVTVTLDAAPDGADEFLIVNSPSFSLTADNSGSTTLGSGLQVAYVYTAASRELVLTNLTGPGDPLTAANAEEMLETLAYRNTSEDPTIGARTFTIVLEDTSGLTSPPADAVVTVFPVNDAPTAGSNSGSVTEDGAVTVAVLANDGDVDGTLNAASVQIDGTAAAGAPLVIVGQGTWTVNTLNGNIGFTPEPDFDGTVDPIQYTVRDNLGAISNLATVAMSIIPTNDAPTALLLAGNTGTSINSDGNNGAYYKPDDSGTILGGLTQFTIETQFSNNNPTTAQNIPIFNYYVSGILGELDITIFDTTTTPYILIEVGGSWLSIPTSTYDPASLLDGGQHTLSFNWDNNFGDWSLFEDGVQVATGTGLNSGHTLVSNGVIVFGQEQDSLEGSFSPSEVFAGTYFDIRIFDDVRTPAEITAGTNTTLPSSEPNLIANWQFADGETTTVTDTVSGNNLNLTQSGEAGFTASTPVDVVSVIENSAAGTVIGSFSTTDVDTGDTFSYLLTSDPSGLFEIVGNQLRVATGANVDYETATSHAITVEVTDGGGAALSRNLTIEVTNRVEAVTGHAIWGDNTNVALSNEWDGSAYDINGSTVNLGDEFRIMQAAEAPTRDEIIVVGVINNRDVKAQIWDGSSWAEVSLGTLGKVSENYWWGAEVAYEQSSGDALMVWNDDRQSSGQELRYSTWNGSTWSTVQSISGYTGDEPQHMKLSFDPSSDEMVLIVSDKNADDWAFVWNGSSWGNMISLDTTGGGETAQTAIAVSHEADSGDAIVTYGKQGSDDIYYRVWDGAIWSSESSMSPPGTVSGDPRWIVSANDLSSDRVVVGVTTRDNDAWVNIWNGSSWEASVQIDSNVESVVSPNIAVAFESASGHALVTYSEDNSNTVYFRTWDSVGGWSSVQTLANFGDRINSMTLDSSPNSNQIMLMVQDDGRDLYSILWDGSSWGTPTQLENDTGENRHQPFVFVWDQEGVLNTSPIAFDLNRDDEINVTGETTAQNKAGIRELGDTVQFDTDGDGDLETIEWLDGSGDALLVNNVDGNAANDMNGSRLFGDQGGAYEHGYQQLAEFDSNADGVISGDEGNGLNLWVDDGNAKVDDNELFTLQELGISEIELQLNENAQDDEGRDLFRSTATLEDGSKIVTEDVWFGQALDEEDEPAGGPDQTPVQQQEDLLG